MGKPILEVDGGAFEDYAGYCREVSEKVFFSYEEGWHGNLDAFSDLLRGGFGTPEGGFIFVG